MHAINLFIWRMSTTILTVQGSFLIPGLHASRREWYCLQTEISDLFQHSASWRDSGRSPLYILSCIAAHPHYQGPLVAPKEGSAANMSCIHPAIERIQALFHAAAISYARPALIDSSRHLSARPMRVGLSAFPCRQLARRGARTFQANAGC